MKQLAIILICLATVFLSCQKKSDISISIGQPNEVITKENQNLSVVITSQKQKTFLNGYIVGEDGLPLAGASVLCGGKTVVTDSKGFFYFKTYIDVNKDYALITVSKPGYRTGFRTFTPNRNKIAYHSEKIMLLENGTPQYVPVTGGTVIADGIKLTFPAYSIIKPGGYYYSGNVRVIIRYINPSSPNFPLLVPGMLSGMNSNRQIQALQSFGMANVEITDDAGNKLEIDHGKTVKMEMPAPANGPGSIPLWHFNEMYGIWVQQGTASKVGSVYVAEVNHFSIWNVDLEFNDFELNLKFLTTTGTPVSNLRVDVYRPNNIYTATFYTDNAGEATLINCPSNEAMTLKAIYICDTLLYSIAPVTQSRSETITMNSGNSYSLAGTLFQCNNQPLSNQAFQVFLSGGGIFAALNGVSDAQGHFNLSTVFPSCMGGWPLNAQTTAYFNNQYYISSTAAISPGINNYNPHLCDTMGGGGIYNDSDIVNIPDPVLLATVRLAINKPTGTIYYIDVKNLSYLDATGGGGPNIQSIIGLQYFTGLVSLDIPNNNISDISPLQNLVNLIYLNLEFNQISNVFPLQNLTTVKYLFLAANLISNISVLQNLTSLNELGLGNNTIASFLPLQSLTSLKDLEIANSQLTDVSFLQNLTQLRRLALSGNLLSNITPLQNLPLLHYLYISDNQISNLTPLQNLTLLDTLAIENNQITNLTPLQNLSLLKQLWFSFNQVTNINPLQNLTSLKWILAESNQISDITPLQNITSLELLHLSGNNISNVTPLQNLNLLNNLTLTSNSISNVTPLQNLNSLQNLEISVNLVPTILPLISGVPALTNFSVVFGNTVPPSEITAMQASHPGCTIY